MKNLNFSTKMFFAMMIVVLFVFTACSKVSEGPGDGSLIEDENGDPVLSGNLHFNRELAGFADDDLVCIFDNTYFTLENPTPRWSELAPQDWCVSFALFQDQGVTKNIKTGVVSDIIAFVLDKNGFFKAMITQGLALGDTELTHLVSKPAGIAHEFQIREDGKVYQEKGNQDKVAHNKSAFYRICNDTSKAGCLTNKNTEVFAVGSPTGDQTLPCRYTNSGGGYDSFQCDGLTFLATGTNPEPDVNYFWILVHDFGKDGLKGNQDDRWFQDLTANTFVNYYSNDSMLTDIEDIGGLDEGFPVQSPTLTGIVQAFRFTFNQGNTVTSVENDKAVTLEILLQQKPENMVTSAQGLTFSTTVPTPGGQTIGYTDMSCYSQDTGEYIAGNCSRIWENVPSGEYILNPWSPAGQYLNGVFFRVNKGNWMPATCLKDLNNGTPNPPLWNLLFKVGNQAVQNPCNNIEQTVTIGNGKTVAKSTGSASIVRDPGSSQIPYLNELPIHEIPVLITYDQVIW